MCFPVLVGLVVLGPVLLLLSAALRLGSHGPAGFLAAVLLVMATVLLAARAAGRAGRWWRSTKAPAIVEIGPRRRG